MIARALLQKPELLLLDNPFIGLDVQSRKAFHGIVNHVAASGRHGGAGDLAHGEYPNPSPTC